MHFILGAVVTLIIFILRLIESTRDAGIITAWVLRIFPSFSFAEGIINIGNKSLYAIRNKKPIGFAYDTYDLDIAGGPILMLCLIGTFSFIMVFVVEHFQHSSSVNKLLSHEN
jgi:ATP-binding cassette subfamily A (ABC1) protein 3